ncbi:MULTISPECIES: hypothetical protein [unclassified Moorena]|nr:MULTISPECIES: hypothetical protein [unclassified Moorena]NEO11633.1 hypothetical protein [Moorena sp. SIO3E8]NEP99764.1 hypothetical protein [Moorena sp. SIO3F7]
MQSLMGETTPVAHGGNPQDRTGSPRPRCIAYSKAPQLACANRCSLIADS